MTTIHADQLKPGDIVVCDGNDHRITRIDNRDGWAWPIATDDSGWGLGLGQQLINVRRDAA
jgi:hypothetical protein